MEPRARIREVLPAPHGLRPRGEYRHVGSRRSSAWLQLVGRAVSGLPRPHCRPGPRLWKQRGEATSDQASARTRRSRRSRPAAPASPRDLIGHFPEAAPSAGPAHSMRGDGSPGQSRPVPPGLLQGRCQHRRSPCPGVDSQPPRHPRLQATPGPGADRPPWSSLDPARPPPGRWSADGGQAPNRAGLPTRYSSLLLEVGSRSQGPGPRRPSQIRSALGLGVHGGSA